MVLDCVVGATLEHLGNLGPFVIDDAVHEEEDPLLFLAPIDLLDARIQMIVPSLTALLADATIQVLGYECPLLRPVGDDELKEAPVFLCRPNALDIVRLLIFLPNLFFG